MSPIIDCFDGLPVSWAISTSPDSELVNNMPDTAIKSLNAGNHPIIHSNHRAHYRWLGMDSPNAYSGAAEQPVQFCRTRCSNGPGITTPNGKRVADPFDVQERMLSG